MKQFASDKEAKLKEDVFVGPEIRKMMFDINFQSTISLIEK